MLWRLTIGSEGIQLPCRWPIRSACIGRRRLLIAYSAVEYTKSLPKSPCRPGWIIISRATRCTYYQPCRLGTGPGALRLARRGRTASRPPLPPRQPLRRRRLRGPPQLGLPEALTRGRRRNPQPTYWWSPQAWRTPPTWPSSRSRRAHSANSWVTPMCPRGRCTTGLWRGSRVRGSPSVSGVKTATWSLFQQTNLRRNGGLEVSLL
ncbi:putative protein [Hepatitis E virus rat/R63/DEU/2009]|uniref:Uncharacterized protein n=1 Tax=Hepatitis E virus rat/R63/DEU/2009 TaxID=879096 RepID=E0XL21_9VIRU|nr:putative protein [Hepatitis E virus rat/R63/DEU/2009]ADM35752.1 putative protein [Hepatitis E virus rat/R63/DEU/2009]